MSRPACLLLALSAWLAVATRPAVAQEDEFRFGSQVLRRLLHERHFQALPGWDAIQPQPQRTLLILMGDPKLGRWRDFPTLLRFLNDGGAILLATDYFMGPRDDLAGLTGYLPVGYRVRSGLPPRTTANNQPRLAREVDERFLYRGRRADLPECLVVEPADLPEPTVFWATPQRRTSLRVVVNRAGFLLPLRGVPANTKVLARFPRGCYYERYGFLQEEETPHAFAVCREVGKGRVLVLSDHSVLINEMMLQEDNSNLDFASNAIEWLGGEGRRDRVLIVEDGQVQTQLDMRLGAPIQALKQLQRGLAAEADAWLMDAQRKHQMDNRGNELAIEGANRLTAEALGQYRSDGIYLIVALLGTVLLLLYGMVRLSRATHGPWANGLYLVLLGSSLFLCGMFLLLKGHNATVLGLSLLVGAGVLIVFGLARMSRGADGRPVLGVMLESVKPAASPAAEKRRAAVEADDWREYAREAAREWFGSLPDGPADEVGDAPPYVDATGGLWARMRVRRQVRRLWDLAAGEPTPRLGRNGFRKLLAELASLRTALAAGQLSLTW